MKHFCIYILFLLVSFKGFSQEKIEGIQIDSTQIEQKKFDQDSLNDYKNSDEFNYNVVKKEKNIFQRFWDWLGRLVKRILSWMFDDIAPAVGALKSFLDILPYILLAILLYFIIKFFLKVNTNNLIRGNTKIPGITLTDEEELIKNQNLQELVNQAIQAKNYRLAVRYYYLLILQKLTEKELIVWQQEKTNEDYIKEIQETKLHKDFAESTYLYDFVWYGNFDINEVEFSKAENLFSQLKNKIGG